MCHHRLQAAVMTVTVADLKRMHTRALLKALRLSCTSDEQVQQVNDDRMAANMWPLDDYTSKDAYYGLAYVPAPALGLDDSARVDVTIAQLKAELATRGHVPNKQESKALRKAKQLRNRQKGRGDR